MWIIDAHQDLAWNMLSFKRDYSLSAAEIRQREVGSEIPGWNHGDTLLGWPEYQRGRVAFIFATLFAAPARDRVGGWDTQCYASTAEAQRIYGAQLDAYYRMVETHPDKFRLVQTRGELADLRSAWDQDEQGSHPVGLVVLMEGAEAVGEPPELETWWARGVRLVGPAWMGTRFCGGTREPGPMTAEGYALLDGMAHLGFALDISHMDEQAALQALDYYPRRVVASHANAASLVKNPDTNRHLSDQVIRQLVERDGVIGVIPFNVFLKAGWRHGDPRQQVPLQEVVAQIDYICQLAGDALHAGIGTDFDGGFGLQSTPDGIDTVADLQKIGPLLSGKGYSQQDIAAILGGNWYARLDQVLPDSI